MKRHLLAVALGLITTTPGRALSRDFDSGPTHHAGRIDTNEVWHPSGNPHILDDDVWTSNGATLAVAPGCTVLFSADVELYAGYADSGSIVAVGTAESTIVFTSLFDTVPGSWISISFYALTISTARLSYVTVEYAGRGGSPGCAVYLEHCSIKIDHCAMRKNAGYGVYADVRGLFADFSNNAITGSGEYPIRIGADEVRTLGVGNVLTGNTKDGILVDGMNVKTSGTWLNHKVSYVIDDDVGVEDANNSPVLTIAAGSTVKLQPDVEFYVGYSAPGGLIADGTSDSITFTSSLTPPSAGDWRSLSFFGNSIGSQCRLINCKVQYAGSHDGNIYIDNCTPTVNGCDIGCSGAYCIYLSGSVYPAPDTLRALNWLHDWAPGFEDIRVPGVGIEEETRAESGAVRPTPSVVRGVLFLPEASGGRTVASSELLDISGRKVLDLAPGANDVRALAPGVYFVKEVRAQARAQAVRKVVIAR